MFLYFFPFPFTFVCTNAFGFCVFVEFFVHFFVSFCFWGGEEQEEEEEGRWKANLLLSPVMGRRGQIIFLHFRLFVCLVFEEEEKGEREKEKGRRKANLLLSPVMGRRGQIMQ